jgi:hypothetical protein
MKSSRKFWRSVMAGIMILFGLMVLTTMRFAQAGDNQNPAVFPPDALVFGKTYGEWSAVWWQWDFSIPVPSRLATHSAAAWTPLTAVFRQEGHQNVQDVSAVIPNRENGTREQSRTTAIR